MTQKPNNEQLKVVSYEDAVAASKENVKAAYRSYSSLKKEEYLR